MVLKTLHPIKRGSEVAENYGHAFYLEPRKDRRLQLSARYWFDCQCQACTDNLPLLDKLPVASNYNPAAMTHYKAGMDLMLKGNAVEAAECFKMCLKLLYENRAERSQDAIRAEDKLRTCIGNMGTTTFMDNILTAATANNKK